MRTSVEVRIPEPHQLLQENCWVIVKESCCTPTRSRGDFRSYPHMSSASEWRNHVRPTVEELSKFMDRFGIYLRCPMVSCSNQRGDYVNHIASSGCNGWHFKNLWAEGIGGIPLAEGVIIEELREMAWEQINIRGGAVRFNHLDWMVKMWKGDSPPPCPTFGHRPQDVETSAQILPVSAPSGQENVHRDDTFARSVWWPLVMQGAVESFKSNLRIAEVPSQQLYCQLCEGADMAMAVEAHLMSAAHSENVACVVKRFGANGNSLQEIGGDEEGFVVQCFQGMHGCVWLNHLTLQSGFRPLAPSSSESSYNYAAAEASPLSDTASGAASSQTPLAEANSEQLPSTAEAHSEQLPSMAFGIFEVAYDFNGKLYGEGYLSLDAGTLVYTSGEHGDWVFAQMWSNGAFVGPKGLVPKNHLKDKAGSFEV